MANNSQEKESLNKLLPPELGLETNSESEPRQNKRDAPMNVQITINTTSSVTVIINSANPFLQNDTTGEGNDTEGDPGNP